MIPPSPVDTSGLHLAADDATSAMKALVRAEKLAAGSHPDPHLAADLKIRMADCLQKHGKLAAVLERLRQALNLLPADGEPILRGKVLFRDGRVHRQLGNYERALKSCRAAYELLRTSDDHVEIGQLELALGTIHMRLGRISESQQFYESALFSFRRIGYREGIA